MKPALILMLATTLAHAQLTVTVSPPEVTGQKAVVSLEMRNNLTEAVESARAVCFLTDEQGRTIGQPTTRWVIGGQSGPASNAALAPGATNTFHFVVTADKPLTTTNLNATLQFSRVVLRGGKMADPVNDVRIQEY
jgi:hypothetical protein